MIHNRLFPISFLLLCLLLSTQDVQAQQLSERRFVVFVDGNFSRNHENSIKEWRFFIPRYIVSPGVEYALGKRTSIGASMNLFRFRFDPTASIEYMYQDSLPDQLLMSGLGGSLFVKKFLFKRANAPIGFFLKFQLDWNYTRIQDFPLATFSKSIYGVKFELGRDYLIQNRYRVSWGAYFSLTNNLSRIFNTMRPNIVQTAEKKFFNDFLFGTRFSIGFLPF